MRLTMVCLPSGACRLVRTALRIAAAPILRRCTACSVPLLVCRTCLAKQVRKGAPGGGGCQEVCQPPSSGFACDPV